ADILLAHGANINDVTKGNSETLMFQLMRGGKVNMVAYALDHGARIDIPNARAVYPLHVAVQEDRRDIVAFLLDKGADIEVRTRDAQTPLHLAVLRGSAPMVELLLARG